MKAIVTWKHAWMPNILLKIPLGRLTVYTCWEGSPLWRSIWAVLIKHVDNILFGVFISQPFTDIYIITLLTPPLSVTVRVWARCPNRSNEDCLIFLLSVLVKSISTQIYPISSWSFISHLKSCDTMAEASIYIITSGIFKISSRKAYIYIYLP